MKGIERRIAAGLPPQVASVASVFISRWDAAVIDKVPEPLNDKLGIAIGKSVYKIYRDLLASPRWQRAFNSGARPQRLLFASTGTKNPKASDVLYVNELAAPLTVDTIPEKTLKAFAEHGEVDRTLPLDGGDRDTVFAQFAAVGVEVESLAAKLQSDGATAFVKSWNELMAGIESQRAQLREGAWRSKKSADFTNFISLNPRRAQRV